MVKFLMRSVMEASEILGMDAKRWQDLLDHLPDYETMEVDGQAVFVSAISTKALASNRRVSSRVLPAVWEHKIIFS